MVRYRKYRKYKKAYKLQKYSNETQHIFIGVPVPAQGQNPVQQDIDVIVNTDVQGMRKCKNFTLQLMSDSTAIPIMWALVYVPEGTQPSNMSLPNQNNVTSLYEPNQNVIMSGILDTNSGTVVKRTRLARNLNSGDRIVIVASAVVGHGNGGPTAFLVQLNYAISF